MRCGKILLLIGYTIIIILSTILINNYIVMKKVQEKFGKIEVESLSKNASDTSEDKYISAIARNLKSIRKKIAEVYKGEVDDKKLIQYAMKGYVEGLGDKYSEYYVKDEWSKVSEEVKGKYVGIGIEVVEKDKQKIINGIMKNTPAEKSRIKRKRYYNKCFRD